MFFNFLTAKSYQLKTSQGFTLLEAMLSVALITIIAGISFPISQSFQNKNNLDVATNEIVQTLRRAQVLSQAINGDISWGMHITIGNITLFKGESYAIRDIAFDEVFEIPTNIIQSGLSEIVFAKFTGFPQTTGIITLTNNNEARNIIINNKGLIQY
ncbi:hypothetical protein CVV26_00625 [Candidatus Kuenenbacteria bacterium HGW-Kuenenbacteria-1]|uniref:General secretion pathway GspH domain-containing protein n=1 Tax=Candidatus Kuenenbacteria bacterium HGW-Kuenenbacteria-1 TaxID=2013812 RepID=A0A2N1UPG7_9BACT|nr:MAG: hypothetical protein CVV26_00625 [Candidatus Kuenenbacteria bacterium HGW-Kuenenbacteria-1]